MASRVEKFEERGARWANILAVLPGSYCAFVLFLERNGASMIAFRWSSPFFLSLILFLLCICMGAVLNFLRKRKEPLRIGPNSPSESSIEVPRISTFGAEVYRVVVAPKLPLWGETHSLFKAMGRDAEFLIDVDLLAELYIVNATSETQYIRELIAFVEVDGKDFPLLMQGGFYAYELNGQDYDWCLDPTPKDVDSVSDRRARLETLTPIAASFPATLEPRRPIRGWIKLLASKINPDKLKGEAKYRFSVRDSLGVEHPINPAKGENRGEIAILPVSRN